MTDYTQPTVPVWSDYEYNPKLAIKCSQEVQKAVRRGELVKPDKCACGEPKPHAHHFNYDRPLDVHWCCRKCHQRIHKFLAFCRQWERFLIYMKANNVKDDELKPPLLDKNGRPLKKTVKQDIWDKCSDLNFKHWRTIIKHRDLLKL